MYLKMCLLFILVEEIKVVLNRCKFFEQVPFDDFILIANDHIFLKFAWMVRLKILSHFTGLNAKVSEVKVYGAG